MMVRVDHLHALERVLRGAQRLGLDRSPDAFQFVDQDFEPELVDLVHHDEEQLIVGLGQPVLQLEQLRDSQIRVVAEAAARGVLQAHPAQAVWRALFLRFSGRGQVGFSLFQKSVTTRANKGGDA